MNEVGKRNVIYHNVCLGGVAMTLTGAHHSFAFFMRKGKSSMTTVIEVYEHDSDKRVRRRDGENHQGAILQE